MKFMRRLPVCRANRETNPPAVAAPAASAPRMGGEVRLFDRQEHSWPPNRRQRVPCLPASPCICV